MLVQVLNLSVLQFSLLKRINCGLVHIQLMLVKSLEQCLVHNQCCVFALLPNMEQSAWCTLTKS